MTKVILLFFSLFPFFALAKHHNALSAFQCGNNDLAETLAQYIKVDSEQQRLNISCDPRLVNAAKKKVYELASSGYVFHGRANGRLRDEGFELPSYYGFGMANQVEALAGGQVSASKVWQEFKSSASHASHLLGESDFYLEQNKLGVAYLFAKDSPHQHYWVVYLAKENISSKKDIFYGPIPNKSATGVIFSH